MFHFQPGEVHPPDDFLQRQKKTGAGKPAPVLLTSEELLLVHVSHAAGAGARRHGFFLLGNLGNHALGGKE